MTQPGKPTKGGGSILTRKTGPLPNWVWMALLLLAALIFSMWQRNRQATGGEDDLDAVTEPLPGDQTPPPVFIIPQAPQPTVPVNVEVNLPPGVTPPAAPPAGGRPPAKPKPKPPAPKPPAKPTPAQYAAVKVAKYTSRNPPWNSTLWGIAEHYPKYGGKNWSQIWNDPKNAALKKKRGKPERIQPGDTIYVRVR